MTGLKKYILVVLIIFVSLNSLLFSAAPEILHYQGKLFDQNGDTLPDGSYNLIFSIYTSYAGGSPVWTSGPVAISVAGGLFEYNLGEGNPISLLNYNQDLFVGVKVESDQELPRTQLLATPFARYVTYSDSARVALVAGHAVWADTIGFAPTADSLDGQEPSYYLDWNNLTNVPAGWIDGEDDDCEGTITSVTGNNGLTGSGSSGNVTISINSESITPDQIIDEAGVAQNLSEGAITVNSGSEYNLLQRTITAPTDGYALAIGSCTGNIDHVYGAGNIDSLVVRLTGPNGDDIETTWSPALSDNPTSSFKRPLTVTGIFSVTEGDNVFALTAYRTTGSSSTFTCTNRVLSIVFIPAAYGNVYTNF